MTRTYETQHFLGTDDEGNRYYADIALDRVDKESRFTDHTEGVLVWEFAVSGSMFLKGTYRDSTTGGQMCEDFRKVTSPAPGWSLEDIELLVRLWERWHLNGMNAWCDHQVDEARLRKFKYEDCSLIRCPEGYKYGSAWLARHITERDIEDIRRLQSLPAGDIPRVIRLAENQAL